MKINEAGKELIIRGLFGIGLALFTIGMFWAEYAIGMRLNIESYCNGMAWLQTHPWSSMLAVVLFSIVVMLGSELGHELYLTHAAKKEE